MSKKILKDQSLKIRKTIKNTKLHQRTFNKIVV